MDRSIRCFVLFNRRLALYSVKNSTQSSAKGKIENTRTVSGKVKTKVRNDSPEAGGWFLVSVSVSGQV